MLRLKELRIRNNVTQKQVAEALNLSTIAIQNYENNRRKPTYDILIALADYFEVSLDYLVGRDDTSLEVDTMTFSEGLKRFRKDFKLTQKQVANGIDVAESLYQRYEYGKVIPSISVFIAIAEKFDVSIDYLVGLSDDPID